VPKIGAAQKRVGRHLGLGPARFGVALDRYGVDMSATERVEYDEFGLFHENASEYGLPFDVPPAVRREYVEVEPGRRLSALVWGTGEPELVLLHGGSQNAHTWDTVAMALRPKPLIAIDLPGHGHSDGPGERQRADRSPRGAADDVAVVIRALAPNAGGVVGMSYGGLTTIALTECAPDLVRKVLLVDVLPGLKAEHARHIVDFVNGPATFARFDDLLARTKEFNPQRSVSSLRRGILHNAVQLDDGSWVWRHSRWRLDAAEQTEADASPAADKSPAGGAMFDDLLNTLERIQVPLLLARGMRPDSVLRDDDEAELVRRLPSAQVVHFDEAGHSIQGDMPVQLAATIQAFIP
jgi:pimeloyl-ACP methyl ester carboxylesterase